MNVLMINPNRNRPHVSPVGLEYVCNSLLRENIEFDVVDLNFEREKVVYRKLQNTNVDIVGITVRNIDSLNLATTEFFLPGVRKLVDRIKNTKDCKVVLGGAGFSTMPQEAMEYTGADFGVAGYGEEALPKLVRAVREGGSLSKIDNLVWRKDGKFQVNRRSTGDYENIPVRRRNIVRNRSYFRVYGIGNIEEKRGCYKRCGFCCEPEIVGCKVVTRKISHVIEELKELKSMGIHHVYFADSEFNVGEEKHQIELCEQLIKSKVGITWTVTAQPEPKRLSRKLLNLMKTAGCKEIVLSADSGSNEILSSMGKKHTTEDTAVCTEYIRKENISVSSSFLVGWPGETTKTVEETFTHIKRCKLDGVVIIVGIRIFPHTRLSRIAVDEGFIPEDSDFLKPIFYRPEQVLHEFMPLVRRFASSLSDSNCFYPSRAADFLNLFVRNVYLSGDFISRGFTDFVNHLNNLSKLEKLKLLGKTALDYTLPFRCRFIPIAEATG
jgi:radical SAM superfamily enzyme YgiQ (UPF0313 family)